MHHFRLLAAIACSALLAGCGGSGGSGGSNDGGNGGSGGGAKIPLSVRLGWDQQATDAAQLNTLQFALYLDDVRSELTGASCSSTGGNGDFPCSAGLPSMTAGQHSLQLTSSVVAGTRLESARSAPLTITVSATGGVAITAPAGSESSSAAVPAPPPVGELTTGDGVRLRIDAVAAVDAPSAIAASDGPLLFIAYGSHGGSGANRVRIIREGIAIGDEPLAGPAADNTRGVVDLAVDPQFERTHFLYVLDVTADGSPAFRLSRYREAGGRLGERAVLLDGVPAAASAPSAGLTFGTDGQLYVAFDDGGDPEGAKRLASYNGKVLRLTADGTTPSDRRAASPIFASNFRSPRSLSWDGTTASLWVADPAIGLVARLRPGAGRVQGATTYSLPLSGGPASLAMYRGTLIPALRGSLLAAPAAEAGILLRARFTGTDQNTIASTERLAVPGGSAVRLIETGPDGTIYLGTDSQVLRVTPR